MLQKLVRIFFGVCLIFISVLQFYLAMIFTSDIPVKMDNNEFILVITLSGIILIIYILYMIFNRIRESFLILSIVFLISSVLWGLLLAAIIRLEGYGMNVLYMGLVGFFISFTLLITSIVQSVLFKLKISNKKIP